MPKRIVDGEALWMSDKVKSLPEEFRLHYANWLPMAEANGVFEANPARIHARIYAFLRPDISVEGVKSILKAFIKAGLVRTWDESGKTWGFFSGIDKAGRLPELRYLERYKNLPPPPPAASVAPQIRYRIKRSVVYFLQQQGTRYIKIGRTARRRLIGQIGKLQTGSPTPLTLLGTMAETPTMFESDIQKLFSASKVSGEWFKETPELLKFIEENKEVIPANLRIGPE